MPRYIALICLPLLVCTVLLAPLQHVHAHEDEDAIHGYSAYAGPGWGVEIGLSDNGRLLEPGHPDWARDDLDWLWLSNEEDTSLWPIYQIDGSTIGVDDEHPQGISFTDDEFSQFYDQMVADLADDPALTVFESDPNHVGSDGRRWQMFSVEEVQDGGTAETSDDVVLYYYSLFTLDSGVLRLVNFYYEPLGEDDDMLTAMDVMLALDPHFTGDSLDSEEEESAATE